MSLIRLSTDDAEILITVHWHVQLSYNEMRLSSFPFWKQLHRLLKFTYLGFFVLKYNIKSSFLQFFFAAFRIYIAENISVLPGCLDHSISCMCLSTGLFRARISATVVTYGKVRLQPAQYLRHLDNICPFNKKRSQISLFIVFQHTKKVTESKNQITAVIWLSMAILGLTLQHLHGRYAHNRQPFIPDLPFH